MTHLGAGLGRSQGECVTGRYVRPLFTWRARRERAVEAASAPGDPALRAAAARLG